MRIALDTNILAYAEGIGDAPQCSIAAALIAEIPVDAIILPAQTLGELYRILVGNAGRNPVSARAAILSWADSF